MIRQRLLRWTPIAVALVVGAFAALWPPVEFRNLEMAQLGSRFAVVFFFALLIERTVEIVMTIWRSEEAYNREAVVQRLVASGVAPTDPGLVAAQTSLIAYRAETQQRTLPLGFALGLLISAFGLRALSQFVDPATMPAAGAQRWWWNASDILFTGALLAGGADPIHKLLDVYRKAMESTAAKAAGTKPA